MGKGRSVASWLSLWNRQHCLRRPHSIFAHYVRACMTDCLPNPVISRPSLPPLVCCDRHAVFWGLSAWYPLKLRQVLVEMRHVQSCSRLNPSRQGLYTHAPYKQIVHNTSNDSSHLLTYFECKARLWYPWIVKENLGVIFFFPNQLNVNLPLNWFHWSTPSHIHLSGIVQILW